MSGRLRVSAKEERIADGYIFASKAELHRYNELKLMLKAGLIKDLKRQPKYELQPAFVHPLCGKVRALSYVADFAYTEVAHGLVVVEDVKGHLTEVYKIKRKLFLAKYPAVDFREVKA